ncbi:MAG: alpha-L-rhamnosidase C-terminal domain-containing protein [Phycisphaeraceae bacterium]
MSETHARRVLTDRPSFAEAGPTPFGPSPWPANWLQPPAVEQPPMVWACRLRFALNQPVKVRIHVTADERYELFLDGERIGRGPERGAPQWWYYETYELELSATEHTLVARCWCLGVEKRLAPSAQMHVHPGFLLAAEAPCTERLSTGVAAWEVRSLDGRTFLEPPQHEAGFLAGGFEQIDAAADDFEPDGGGEGWQPAKAGLIGRSGGVPYGHTLREHTLKPAELPAMVDQPWSTVTVRAVQHLSREQDPVTEPIATEEALTATWQRLFEQGQPVQVPPHTRQRAILDLNRYLCAYSWLKAVGGPGSRIRMHWAESAYVDPPKHVADGAYVDPNPRNNQKGNRNEVLGRYFVGKGDVFLPGEASHTFQPLWWRAGRYVELCVETGEQGLTIEGLGFRETRYPTTFQDALDCSDDRLNATLPILRRGMQMCMHETYMDCPYYEQLMYVGDTRLEVLTTYAADGDDRLPRKAIRMFGLSRDHDGLTWSRYPCSNLDPQTIPPFSLWWVAMVHDFAMWRGDEAFVRQQMPGVRCVLEAFRHHVGSEGVVHGPLGWNFVDWVPDWTAGMPPTLAHGPSGALSWHYVLVLRLKAKLERWLGEPALADRDESEAKRVSAAAMRLFFCPQRGLLAEDVDHTLFGEHSACLAILGGTLEPALRDRLAEALFCERDLVRSTIYFSFYLLETAAASGRMDAFFDRLELWRGLPELGLTTPPEQPEPTRSDCHAWGSHPLYHLLCSVLGIRPAGFGFPDVVVRPQPGPLRHIRGQVIHPKGRIEAELERDGERLRGTITLPAGLRGELHLRDQIIALTSGPTSFEGAAVAGWLQAGTEAQTSTMRAD